MTKRDRIVLGVVALVVVVAGFYVGIVKPKTTELSDLDAQVTAAEERRDVALSNLASAAAAKEQYRRDSATLAVLGKAVPADDGVPSLLYQLNAAARRSAVDFDALTVGGGAAAAAGEGSTPGLVAGPNGLSQLPLTLSFDGSFFKLDRFLREVHKFARIGDERVDVRGRLLTVDAIALTPNSSSGKDALKAALTVNAYVAPGKDGKAAAGSAGTTGTATAAGTTSASDTSGTGASSPGTDSSTTTSQSTGAAE